MKEELPRFFEMASRFITPLFHSFYYMQWVSWDLKALLFYGESAAESLLFSED